MITKFCLVLLLIVFAVANAFSQVGYVISDSAYSQGYNQYQTIFKNNREVKFTRSKGLPLTTYLPKDLKEYGFDKNDIYVKRIVKDGASSTPYFLHRVINGESKLYELKTEKKPRYFVERDSTLVEVTNGSLAAQLSSVLKPCESFGSSIARSRYNKGSLMRIVSLNNSCFKGLFPTLRKGVLFGYSNTSITLGSSFDHTFLVSSSASPFIGAFVDFPLSTTPAWFINVQAYFQQSHFGGFVGFDTKDLNYSFKRSVINMPLLIKYRGTGLNWRPFISAGPSAAYQIQQDSYWITSQKKGSQVITVLGTMDNIRKLQVSGTVSAGVEISVTQKISAGLEFRYAKLIDGSVGAGDAFALISSIYF